jgi:hypothetical protein
MIRQVCLVAVGAAEGCDLLILKNQHQKIAAFGNSYQTKNNALFLL